MSEAAPAATQAKAGGSERFALRPASTWSNASPVVRAIFVIALIGTLEAAYLTYVHYHGLGGLLCVGGSHGQSTCEQVQSSTYSKLAGIPVAILGLVSYLTILVSLRIRGELGRALGFAVAFMGFGFSLYLTYREVFTLHEICEWCVGSATWMTLLAILTGTRFLRGELPGAGAGSTPPSA